MAYVHKSSKSPAGAKFVKTSTGSKSVQVSAGKGGTRVGVTHCSSKRAASNLKAGAY